MADNEFQDILSTFQKVVDDLREHPAEVISKESVDFAKQLTIQTALRSKAEREIAAASAEGAIAYSIRRDMERESLLRTEQRKAGLKFNKEAELEMVQQSIESNKSILEQLDEQIKAYGIATKTHREATDLERRMIELQTERASLLKNEANLSEQIRQDMLEQNTLQTQAVEQAQKLEEVSKRQEKLNEQMEHFLGFSVASIQKRLNETNELLRTTGARLTILAGALGSLLKYAFHQLMEIRQVAGTTFQQTLQLGKTAVEGMKVSLQQGLVITSGQAAEIAGDLAEHMGSISHVTPQLVADAGRLHVMFGLSSEEATTFAANLAHVAGVTPTIEHNILMTAESIGRIHNIAPGQIFKEMAENTDLMARAGASGAAKLAEAAAFARNIGTNLKAFEGFRDQALDISTMIENTTRLSMLGVRLGSTPFALAAAAQSGDIKRLQLEEQKALRPLGDLSKLGTIQQNLLSQAFGGQGIDILSRIQREGVDITQGTPQQQAQAKMQESTDNTATSVANLATNANKAALALAALALSAGTQTIMGLFRGGAGAGGSILGRVGRFLGRGVGLGGGAAAGGEAAAAGETVSGLVPAATTTAAGTGFWGTSVGAAGAGATGGVIGGGLLAGAGIGTLALEASNKYLHTNFNTFEDFARIRSLNQVTPQQQASLAMARRHSAMLREGMIHPEGGSETTAQKTEDKLGELVRLFKNGSITVVLDGRKVGKLIAAAQPTDSTTGAL